MTKQELIEMVTLAKEVSESVWGNIINTSPDEWSQEKQLHFPAWNTYLELLRKLIPFEEGGLEQMKKHVNNLININNQLMHDLDEFKQDFEKVVKTVNNIWEEE